MYRGVIVTISIVMVTLMVFSIHNAYAISYDIKDQVNHFYRAVQVGIQVQTHVQSQALVLH
jgi:hypothetical protein